MAVGSCALIRVTLSMETTMNQSRNMLTLSPVYLAAIHMVLAGVGFAVVNAVTQYVTMSGGLASTSDAFWQYFFGLVFSLPVLVRSGFSALRTRRPLAHIVRIALAVLGVQAWVAGLANGVPIWQAIALVMTSPFFVTAGAGLLLGERVGQERWAAIALGFCGALIILRPWSDAFTVYALLPVAAALLWGGTSLITKALLTEEKSATVTLWLLLLLTPINGAFSLAAGFQIPSGGILLLLVFSGLVMALSQYSLARAYHVADASYVQAFDDLKLPINVAMGWAVFGYAPSGYLWLGAVTILAASMWGLLAERRRTRADRATEART
jgi:drug/metabolite transporter (DMT)-like permease